MPVDKHLNYKYTVRQILSRYPSIRKNFDFVKKVLKGLGANLRALARIKEGKEAEEIIDIFENGARRMREEKFNDAVARFYRCLELIAQHRLKKYRIDTQKPDFSLLKKEVFEKYKKERGGILPREYKEGIGGMAG